MRESFSAAYHCIDNIYRKKSFSGQELNKFLSRLPAEKRALTAKLVYGAVDKNIELTYIIKNFAKSVKPSVLPVLQIGVFCFLYLSILPAVVVNECVELAKSIGKGGVAGFVNAVLKNISQAVQTKSIKYPKDRQEFLSVKYSYPLWAVRRLISDYGEETAENILRGRKDIGYSHIRCNPEKISAEDFEKLLKDKNIDYKKTFEGCFYVKGNTDAIKSNLYTSQSLSSIYVCSAVGCEKGQTVLDVCAAPGGKSVFLAQQGAIVTACDIHPHRVELIKKYAARMATKLTVLQNDATIFDEKFKDGFDRVLCDVPCSGFGVVESKPDIKLFKTEADIDGLPELQLEILRVSSRYVKTGGSLVYSTCTVFKKENQDVVNEFLRENTDFVVDRIDLDFEKTQEGFLQFLPFRDDTDGFFIAKLKRIC